MSPMRTCSHQRHWEALHAHYLIVSKKIMHHSCAMGLYSVHLSYFKHPMIRCTILVGYWQCCSSLDQALKVSEPSFLPRKHKHQSGAKGDQHDSRKNNGLGSTRTGIEPITPTRPVWVREVL
ncbi:unnamed protein product [Musa acuminata subsp. burmannicoides]